MSKKDSNIKAGWRHCALECPMMRFDDLRRLDNSKVDLELSRQAACISNWMNRQLRAADIDVHVYLSWLNVTNEINNPLGDRGCFRARMTTGKSDKHKQIKEYEQES